jgi:hypothetical protein
VLLGVCLFPFHPSAQEVEDVLPVGPSDETVARVTVAFEEGDSGALLDLSATRVEIVLLGQGARYSRGQAALILRDFFRRYPPERVVLSERSASEDGRAAMGRYWSGNSSAPFALYVGFHVEDDEAWTLDAIRIERTSFQRTGTY